MAGVGRYEISPASFDIGTIGTPNVINLAQLRTKRLSTNLNDHRVRAGGDIDAVAYLGAHAQPSVQMTTSDLLTAFTNIPIGTGVCANGPGGSVFRLTEREECAAWATGAEHITVTSEKAMMYIESITVDDSGDEPAMATIRHLPLLDTGGSNSTPYTVADGVDFSAAPSAGFTSAYYLAGIYHNSTIIDATISCEINFGIQTAQKPQTPGPFPTLAYITDRNTEIRFRAEDPAELTALSGVFGSAVSSEFAVYLQSATTGESRVAAASSAHIKISWTAGKINTDDLGGDAANDADMNLVVKPTSAPSISLTSTIP